MDLILKQNELATTASVKAMAENLINGVNNGEIDPLRLQVFFAAVEKMAKAVKDAVRDNSVDEVLRRSDDGKSCKVAGATVEVTETGVKYDYSVIPSWHNAQRKIDALKELQKSIEGKAKFASEKSPYIDCDTETGEQTEIISIPRTSTTAIKIILGK